MGREEKMGDSRGSEWHRWDIHLHTPQTRKNDQYEGKTPEEQWDNFYHQVNKYLEQKDGSGDIVGVGITDYCSIENYKKVVADGRISKDIFCFPNVEMRFSIRAERTPVNIHFLFDPKYINLVEEQFLNGIRFEYHNESYCASKASLIRFARDYNKIKESEQALDDDDKAYNFGISKFVPSFESFRRVFHDYPTLRQHTLIGVSNNSGDGASGIKEDQLSAVRDSVYRFSDFILSGNPEDRKFFLGNGIAKKEEIINVMGALKPCLHGSDAHSLERVFEPNKKRYCWIKAEPTFNGLRQVIYEPESRVQIAPLKPEAKPGDKIIRSVKFEEDDFEDKEILLNQNLNCIIGGKSTGKTLLLHNIAQAIDPEQVGTREEATNTSSRKVNTKVTWKYDSQRGVNSNSDPHKIIYIPQSYLNRLTDEKSSSDINDLIEPVLLRDTTIADAQKNAEAQTADLIGKIRKEAFNFAEQSKVIRHLNEQMKEIGTKQGMEEEIGNISEQREALTKKNQISENDLARYNEAQKSLHKAVVELSGLANDKKTVESIETLIGKKNPWPILATDSIQSDLDRTWENISNSADSLWAESKNSIIKKIKSQTYVAKNDQHDAEAIIEQLKPRFDKVAELKSLSNRLNQTIRQLDQFSEIEKKRNSTRNSLTKALENLFNLHNEITKTKTTFADKINNTNKDNNGGIILGATVVYRYDLLASEIKHYTDGRKLRSRKALHSFIQDASDNKEVEDPQKQLRKLIEDSVNDVSLFTVDAVQALTAFFSDQTDIKYGAKLDGDELSIMSPGKRSLLYLKLLIELDSSECPILIDQPEDDLDNRSIFKELIPFLKQKKSNRQMIIVTHNANVVLGADSEEIIIANQDGDDSHNVTKKFEYISGGIEDDSPQDSESRGILKSNSIQEHICDVLEGGREAFDLRRQKYADLVE